MCKDVVYNKNDGDMRTILDCFTASAFIQLRCNLLMCQNTIAQPFQIKQSQKHYALTMSALQDRIKKHESILSQYNDNNKQDQ